MIHSSLSQLLKKTSFTLSISFLILSGCVNSSKDKPVNLVLTPAKKEPSKKSISQELEQLESEYTEMLLPISSIKKTQPEVYWFIVSWLKSSYNTPDWTGYYSEDWKIKSKQKGIDCSGFSRVMLDQVFGKQVSGGSQRLFNQHCTPIDISALEIGDLVFFRAPYSTNDKIVHVGVYLKDNNFVHATSVKSAAKGLGIAVNSLEEKNWAEEFVTGGRVDR